MIEKPSASLEEMQAWAASIMKRPPDVVIGEPERPYLRRWYVVPRNEWANIYLHEILRSDDDRAGHDHPWDNVSILLEGGYEEVQFSPEKPWVEYGRFFRTAGTIVPRRATDTHRLVLPNEGSAISLFMTGPKIRDWGFWCTGRWVPWQEFTAGEKGELIGRGCGE